MSSNGTAKGSVGMTLLQVRYMNRLYGLSATNSSGVQACNATSSNLFFHPLKGTSSLLPLLIWMFSSGFWDHVLAEYLKLLPTSVQTNRKCVIIQKGQKKPDKMDKTKHWMEKTVKIKAKVQK
ncbi:hypothetical protein Tco_1468572 [Tanacetum coccineum]